MRTFELQFQIQEVSEDILDEVTAAIDSGYASHGNVHLLTVWVEAESAVAAAVQSVDKLADLDVEVIRLYEDLVTRQDIADRTSTTRQAVGNWVRQERRVDESASFPNPYNVVGGGVWLWSDVNDWLAQLGKDDGLAHPTAREYDIVNAMLRSVEATAGFKLYKYYEKVLGGSDPDAPPVTFSFVNHEITLEPAVRDTKLVYGTFDAGSVSSRGRHSSLK